MISSNTRQYMIQRLRELNVTRSQTGKNIDDCDDDELGYELLLAEFRQIDVECEANKFF